MDGREEVAGLRLEHPSAHQKPEDEHARNREQQQAAVVPALEVEMSRPRHEPRQ